MEPAEFNRLWVEIQAAVASGQARALDAALSKVPGGAQGWVALAEQTLWREVCSGRWQKLGAMGDSIGAVRGLLDSRSPTASGSNHLPYRESVWQLHHGIESFVVHGDFASAHKDLSAIATDMKCEEILRWIAWTWLTATSGIHGDLDAAKTAASTALAIAGQMEPSARAYSKAVRAGIGFLRGELEESQRQMYAAISLFEQQGRHHEVSLSWMVFSSYLLDSGRERVALRALGQAIEADPKWSRPHIQLARRAMIAGRVDEAELLLRTAYENGVKSPELIREIQLTQSVNQGNLPLSVATESLWLRERSLTSNVAAALVDFVEEHPTYDVLRMVVGWDLALYGYSTEASDVFKPLLDRQDVEPAIAEAVGEGVAILGNAPPREVSILELIQEHGSTQSKMEEDQVATLEPAIFWVRRAVIGGRLEEAYKHLEILNELSLHSQEVSREKRLFESIQEKRTPVNAASEYFWIQERPMTDVVMEQIEAFAEEHHGSLMLREIMAWDLALSGSIALAERFFRQLAEELDLGAKAQASVREGLELLRKLGSRIRQEGARSSVNADKHALAEFVQKRQLWPSVLDQHILLFIGQTNEIPAEVRSWSEVESFKEGETIQRQGQLGWLLTFIENGSAVARRKRGKPQSFCQIQADSFFGEAGTIWGLPNTTEVVAIEPTTTRVLSREFLFQQVKSGNETATTLLKTLRSWYLNVVYGICPIFAYLDDTSRAEVSSDSKTEIFHKGEQLAVQDKPTPLYVIVSGFARVSLNNKQSILPLGYLCPGDIIGNKVPSPVTVVAETTVTVLSLNREYLDLLPERAKEKLELQAKDAEQSLAQAAAGNS